MQGQLFEKRWQLLVRWRVYLCRRSCSPKLHACDADDLEIISDHVPRPGDFTLTALNYVLKVFCDSRLFRLGSCHLL